MTIATLTFVGVLTLILAGYWLAVAASEHRRQSTLRKRLTRESPAAAPRVRMRKERRKLSAFRPLERVLETVRGITAPMALDLDRAGMQATVGTVLLASGCLALSAVLLVVLFTRQPVLGLPAGLLAGALPFVYVKRRASRRMLTFEEQFPEAIQLIARALRAGHAFTTAVAMVADEMPAPVGPEFKLLHGWQNFGMPLPDALRAFAARIPILDAKFFATAVLTQRDTGGNLSEILDNLGVVIRERFRVKRQVRVISAHGRITGWILAGLPPTLAVAFTMTSDRHMQTLIGDPLGQQMIGAAIALQVIGTLMIRKLVNIQY